MNVALARRRRSGLAVPAIFALGAIVIFVGLGTWQLQRKAWKEALIETLEQRLSAPPGDLPPRERWASLSAANDEFRRVKFSAAFVPRAEALIYTSGSALRSDVSGSGYWVFAPAQLTSGGIVVVNRGFVPEGRQDPVTRAAGAATGHADLVGVMRWPETFPVSLNLKLLSGSYWSMVTLPEYVLPCRSTTISSRMLVGPTKQLGAPGCGVQNFPVLSQLSAK